MLRRRLARWVSQDDLRTNLGPHWRITSIDLVYYSAAIDVPTAKYLLEQISPGITDKLRTDEQGRPTFLMWHLRAEFVDHADLAS